MQVTLRGDVLVVKDESRRYLQQIRSLPRREYKADRGEWYCPYVTELWDALQTLKFPLTGIPRPTKSGYRVEALKGDLLLVSTLQKPEDIQKCKKIPEFRSFSTKHVAWMCRATQLNVKYLLGAFPQAQWSPGAQPHKDKWAVTPSRSNPQDYNHLLGRERQDVDMDQPVDFQFYVTPYYHQKKAWLLSKDEPTFALFMQQGTGKTLVAYYKGVYLYSRGEIDGMVVVCPNGVKDPWAEMIAEYTNPSMKTDVFVWEAKTRRKARDWVLKVYRGQAPFRILIINSEALSSDIGAGIVDLFLSKHACFMALDESSRFKTPSAARTKRAVKLGKKAKHRMIMSGTPVTQGPLDLFSQFKFLDENILGFSSYVAFRDRYAVLGGWNNKQVIGYVRLDELVEKVDKKAFRVTKAECLDLPEQIFQKREVRLTPEQKQLYDQMKDELLVEFGGHKNIIQHAVVQLQILQRIIGGFLPLERVDPDDPDDVERTLEVIPGGNPKLNEVLEICDELPSEKIIIWARYRAELDLIQRTLREKYGKDSVAEYHGGIASSERTRGRLDFQHNADGARFFVGQPQAGGIGLTLTAASTVIYFSNTFSLEDRLQSQDRPHRIGQTKNVTYIDLIAKATMDVRLIAGLRSKKSLADIITGDPAMGWL